MPQATWQQLPEKHVVLQGSCTSVLDELENDYEAAALAMHHGLLENKDVQ